MPTVRATVDLTLDQYKLLKKLKERLGMRSHSDVFREALRVLDYMSTREVYIHTDKGDLSRVDIVPQWRQ